MKNKICFKIVFFTKADRKFVKLPQSNYIPIIPDKYLTEKKFVQRYYVTMNS